MIKDVRKRVAYNKAMRVTTSDWIALFMWIMLFILIIVAIVSNWSSLTSLDTYRNFDLGW